jgi:hypothetical protein
VAEETWHEARLIPTSGINGAEEQERRATSAVLAVMVAVREFGRLMTQPLRPPEVSPPSLTSTASSSQDGPEAAPEAADPPPPLPVAS